MLGMHLEHRQGLGRERLQGRVLAAARIALVELHGGRMAAALIGAIGLVELGAGQAGAVISLMEAAGLRLVARRRDLAGIERCIVLSPD